MESSQPHGEVEFMLKYRAEFGETIGELEQQI